MSVLRELFLMEVEKKYRGDGAGRHLGRVTRDHSGAVQMVGGVAVVNATQINVDPDVLIDNATYPIAAAAMPETNPVLALRKLDTTNTIITDDELQGIIYDKKSTVAEIHAAALLEKSIALANHSMTPVSNTTETPIVLTTGAVDSVTGEKAFTFKDLVRLDHALNSAKVPLIGRILVLCPKHYADIFNDEALQKVFNNNPVNVSAGSLGKLMNYDVFMDYDMPYYTGTAGNVASMNKVAFGATVLSTHRKASFAYYDQAIWKAETTTKIYDALSENDPYNRQSVIGTRKWFVAKPISSRGYAAIVTDGTL